MHKPKRIVVLTATFLLLALFPHWIHTAQERIPPRTTPDNPPFYPIRWNANLNVAPTNGVTIANQTYYSSSKLLVTWNALGTTFDHYEITATDSVRATLTRFSTRETNVTLTELKAGTQYTINLRACRAANCQQAYEAGSASAATPEEFWQLQGTGNSIASATRIIADGNVGAYAFRFGAWAGAELAGRIQLYYNPLGANEKGIKLGVTGSGADTLANFSTFTAINNFGLRSPCPQAAAGQPPPPCPGDSLARSIALFQAVPLLNGKVRLFFEANGTDQRNRILYLDSQDGYTGRDFNTGAGTLCATLADYATGGACEPQVAIGVAGDAVNANARIQHARQFKLGYPQRDDGRWDGAPGTFMVLTANTDGGCSDKQTTQAYAHWDGAAWRIDYAANGCPKLFEAMQAPLPVHLGGVRYKLYFNHNNTLRGQPNDPNQVVKPMKLIYADGALTGSASVVEFEDWETVAQARNLNYLWPDGTLLDEATENRLDDYVMLWPTNDANVQVMYTNMAGPAPSAPVIGMAVLVNP